MAEAGGASGLADPGGRPAGGRRAAPGASRADLVIGLGHPLRGDDGVGWWLAQRARRLRPRPRVLLVPLLTPELCLELAAARRVLFVDAWLQPQLQAAGTSRAAAPPQPLPGAADQQGMPQPLLARINHQQAWPGGNASAEPGICSHRIEPPQLLAITALLQGEAAPAWMLLVPAVGFDPGAAFSSQLQRLLPQAEALLRGWVRRQTGPLPAAASPQSIDCEHA